MVSLHVPIQILHTNSIYCPIESKSILLLIEASWVVASHSCFPSSGDWSLMPLCLQQHQWWFSWSLVWVSSSTTPHSLSSLPLYPPLWSQGPSSQCSQAIHICTHLAWFSFEPNIGYQICVIPLAPLTLIAHTHSLPVNSLFLMLSCDMWVLAQNQDQDTRSPYWTLVDLFWTLLLTAQQIIIY